MVEITTVRLSDDYFREIINYLSQNNMTRTAQKLSDIQILLKESSGSDPRHIPALIKPRLEELLSQLSQEVQSATLIPSNIRDAGIRIIYSLMKNRKFFIFEAVCKIAPKEPPLRRINGYWVRGPYPFIVRRNINASCKALHAFLQSGLPKTLKFYGICFAYLLLVESAIVPIGRKLYAVFLASKYGLPYVEKRVRNLRRMSLGGLYRAFDKDQSTKGLIDEKQVILRNAIGHASFTYEEDADLGCFAPLEQDTWEEISKGSVHTNLAELEGLVTDTCWLSEFLYLIYRLLPLTDLLVVKASREFFG